jgi:hypothetical protein
MIYDLHRRVCTMLRAGAIPETWEWDGISWIRQHTHTQPPNPSTDLAYDTDRHVVTFLVSTGANRGIWEFNGIDWSRRSSDAPPSPAFGALAYHHRLRMLFLHRGRTTNLPLGDTWAWDGAAWLRATPTAPLLRTPMRYDPRTESVVALGDGP